MTNFTNDAQERLAEIHPGKFKNPKYKYAYFNSPVLNSLYYHTKEMRNLEIIQDCGSWQLQGLFYRQKHKEQ